MFLLIKVSTFGVKIKQTTHMKTNFLNLIKKSQTLLQKISSRFEIQEKIQTLPYHSLSPICEADIPQYEEALNWALNNRKEKNIKNIAVSGPYGSGKSSILNTFQKNNSNQDLHFLNISLATFKDEMDETKVPELPGIKNKSKTYGEDLVRLIELSILQQIFYHEEDSKIPDSRFKKIKSYNNKKIFFWTIAIILSALSFIHIFDTGNIFKIQSICQVENKTIKLIFLVIAILICISSVFVGIYKSIRVLTGLRITKFNIKNAEIEINDKINKSILNHHLDEILYFFEVTPYNVVIIEDLDRFQQTEIFTKLREINLLINSSKKLKEKTVVFIYAVRDDMFQDSDRTKFFDFIIPVIPVINSSNSNEILLRKIKSNAYNISDDLIDDISLFIDDMRLLHNIINEFHLYHIKLSDKLIQDKLLSIIIYKNIYPNDFVELANNKGNLFNKIDKKHEYISSKTKELNIKIQTKKDNIKLLESVKINDIKELRAIYISKYIENLNFITSFKINNIDYNFEQVVSDELFDYFVNNNVEYNYFKHYSQQYYEIKKLKVPLMFEDVESKVDTKYSYKERKALIDDLNDNKVEQLKKDLEKLENQINSTRKFKLRDILTDNLISIETNEKENENEKQKKQKQLTNILLRNGYIDEDYLDYISIFHEGSISTEDHMFMINVKNQIPMEFDYKLNKIEKLIEKLDYIDFDKYYMLNYSLLDYILENDKFREKQNQIFDLLSDESENSIRFINGFIDNGINIDSFIKLLCKYWNGYWNFIDKKSTFPIEKKNNYFKLLIEFADNIDIETIASNSNLKPYISNRADFSGVIGDKEKLKSIIKLLNIKFNDIDLNETTKEMLDFICEGDYYKINNQMITLMIKFKGEFNQADFDTRNYYSIVNSKCDSLINYIILNLEEYVKEIYLKIETNTEEDEEALLELINPGTLSIGTKTKIIIKTNTIISDLNNTDTIEIENLLLKEIKVKPIWENLISHFINNENSLSDSAVSYINNIEIAKELSEIKIDIEKPNKETGSAFLKSILLNDKIQIESYSLILKSIPYFYPNLDFETLSKDKVELLISERKLVLSIENYDLLKNTFENLHIKLLEVRHSEFIGKIIEYSLDQEDILSLLTSSSFSNEDKNVILNTVEDSIITGDQIYLSIAKLILQNNRFTINKPKLMHVLSLDDLSIVDRLRIFNAKCDMLDNIDISEFLNYLSEPYSKISKNGKRPLLDNNEVNIRLAQILDKRNYISKFDIEKKGIRISTRWNK